ncbi:aspartate carbamoyltransferase regulatory subunit [Archaeoglobales archaeon]|nr:MAG: aspartate carbamoyltransferase regulatory subunit [Archaeoglobales archaeon]
MKQLTISKIKEGTVIDHINAGKALLVLKILGIHPDSTETVSMAMNVPSKKMGKKDIVKVEGKFINEEQLNKIALIAPKATINLIKDYEIQKKFRVVLPEFIEGIIKCPNRNCISNSNEPIIPKFHVWFDGEVIAKCHYCNKKVQEISEYI